MWDAWPACSNGPANAGRAGELLAATEEMLRVFKNHYIGQCVSSFPIVPPAWVP